MDDEHYWQDAAHNSCAKVRREQARAPTPADDENKTSRTRSSRARSRVVHVRWPLENSTPRERPSPTTLPDLHRHIGSLVASLPPRARLGPPGISTFQITWPAQGMRMPAPGDITRLWLWPPCLSLGHGPLLTHALPRRQKGRICNGSCRSTSSRYMVTGRSLVLAVLVLAAASHPAFPAESFV